MLANHLGGIQADLLQRSGLEDASVGHLKIMYSYAQRHFLQFGSSHHAFPEVFEAWLDRMHFALCSSTCWNKEQGSRPSFAPNRI